MKTMKIRFCPTCKTQLTKENAHERRLWRGGNCRSCCKTQFIKTRYRLSAEDIQELRLRQSKDNKVCCLICGRPEQGERFGIRRLHVDHDHNRNCGHPKINGCKKCVRGLLCNNCNVKILPTLESNLHLQSAWIQQYIRGCAFSS